MNKKNLTLLILIIASITSMIGCQNITSPDTSIKTTSYESASSEAEDSTTYEAIEEKKEEIKNKTNTTVVENTTTTQSNTAPTDTKPASTNSNTAAPTSAKTESSTLPPTTATEPKGTILVKSQHGFTMELPKSWDGKYVLKENPTGLKLSFKTNETVDGDPWLLYITTEVLFPEGEADFNYDTIVGSPTKFNVGTSTYYVGGPSGVTLSDKNSEFDTYLKMGSERAQVINSIKVTRK